MWGSGHAAINILTFLTVLILLLVCLAIFRMLRVLFFSNSTTFEYFWSIFSRFRGCQPCALCRRDWVWQWRSPRLANFTLGIFELTSNTEHLQQHHHIGFSLPSWSDNILNCCTYNPIPLLWNVSTVFRMSTTRRPILEISDTSTSLIPFCSTYSRSFPNSFRSWVLTGSRDGLGEYTSHRPPLLGGNLFKI